MNVETLQIAIIPIQAPDQDKKPLAGIAIQKVTLEWQNPPGNLHATARKLSGNFPGDLHKLPF